MYPGEEITLKVTRCKMLFNMFEMGQGIYSVCTLYCIVEYIYYITTYNMIYKVESLKSSNFKNSFLDENITLPGSLFGFCGVGGGGGEKRRNRTSLRPDFIIKLFLI